MKSHNFKLYAKYGLLFLVIIGLARTAYAETNQLVYYNWSADLGDTVVDNSAHGNNGTNNGSTTFTLPTGQTARHFNGHNRITIPDNAQLSFTDPHITFGVFFRYNKSNPTHYSYLISKGNNAFSICIDPSNSLIIYEVYANGHTIHASSVSSIQPNKDYEAIVTYDGSHAQLYTNGLANGKGVDYSAAALGPGYNTYNWVIGSSSNSAYGLNGTIYAFYLYNRTLNSSEILDLYGTDLRSLKNFKPGGIALSWDDTGHIESCYQYLSLFQQYNATCTINVNRFSNRSQTVIDELNTLHEAGWEIACHGYNHVNSRQFLDNSTPTVWLNQEIFPNIVEVAHYNNPVYTLVYPFSDRNAATDAALAPYFRTLRTRVPTLVNGNVNETPLAYYNWNDAQLLYGVEIDDRSGASLESIEDGIDYAIKTGTVLVLYGHLIIPNVTIPYETSTERLDSILNYTSQNGGVFYLLGDMGNSSWVQLPRFSNVTSNFSVSTNILLAGRSVIFTDQSTNQTTELLDFGDGSPASSTADVTHAYPTQGIYTVNLTVTNDVSSDSMLKTITVVQPTIPLASFTSNCTAGSRPLNIAFTDTSSGLPECWLWDFGDGDISTSQNPVHQYSNIGNYSVTLTLINEKGTNYTQKINYITVLPYIITLTQTPSSNFSLKIISSDNPLTVQFNDTSTGSPTSWLWDFGDGNTSTERNPKHTYFSACTYNVNLTVSNANGTDIKTVTITVLGQSNSSDGSNNGGNSNGGSSRSSGGGSGGAGGSPELQSNVQVKELSQAFVSSGNQVKFDFPQKATPVVNISFDSKKTAGKTTTIAEVLKGKSILVSGLPSDEVYKYLNIWVGNSGFATPENIENAVVCFKVEKSWIQDKNIDQSSITLYRYKDEKWYSLPTSLLSEADVFDYFISETPGFSPFAIMGKMTASGTRIEPGNGTKMQPANGTKTQLTDEIKIQPASVNETWAKNNNGSTSTNAELTPEQKESQSTSRKENTGAPGFDMVCGIVSLTCCIYASKKVRK